MANSITEGYYAARRALKDKEEEKKVSSSYQGEAQKESSTRKVEAKRQDSITSGFYEARKNKPWEQPKKYTPTLSATRFSDTGVQSSNKNTGGNTPAATARNATKRTYSDVQAELAAAKKRNKEILQEEYVQMNTRRHTESAPEIKKLEVERKNNTERIKALEAELKTADGAPEDDGGYFEGLTFMPTSWSDFAKGMGYSAERLGAGLLGFGEDITDFAGSTFYGGVQGLTSLGGLAPNAVSEWAGEAAEGYLENSITEDWEKSIKERYNPTKGDENLTGIGQGVAKVLASLVPGAAAARAASGGTAIVSAADDVARAANLSKATFGVSAAGGGSNEAHEEGASVGKSLTYGVAEGLKEYIIESAFGGIPGLGSGLADDVVTKFVNSPVVRNIVDVAGEGAEEAIAEFVSPFIKRAIYDSDAELATAGEVAEAAILGMVTSGLLKAGIEVPTAISIASDVRKYNQQQTERAGAEFREMGDDVVASIVEEGLASDKSSSSYKQATSLKKKLDAGEEISDVELGRLYQANVKAIEKEERRSAGKQVAPINEGKASAKAATGYGEYGTRAFAEIVEQENGDPAEIQSHFQTAYEAGMTNLPADRVQLDNDIQRIAFNAGKQDYIMSNKKAEANAGYATVYGKESGFVQTDAAKGVKRSTVKTLNTISKAMGIKSMFEETVYNGRANGSMSSDGILKIAKDAENPYFVVAKHEVTHRMQQLAPTQYVKYRDYAVQIASGERGQTGTTLVEAYQDRAANSGVTLSVEQAMDEIAADFTERILKDEKALKDFAADMSQTKETRTVAQKFFAAVRDFINKVKKAFKGNKAKMDAAALKEFGATVEQLERAEKLWKEAFEAAAKSVQNKPASDNAAEYETTADGIRFSTKMSFEEQVDAALAKELDRFTAVYVTETPDIMQAILNDYPMLMTQKHIRDIVAPKDSKKGAHGISDAQIKKLPDLLSQPVMMLESLSTPGEMVVATAELDADGLPVIVAVKPEGKGQYNRVELVTNFVKSMYGRSGFGSYIDRTIKANGVLYVNKKRARSLFAKVRVQFPESLQKDGFYENNIAQFLKNVKGDGEGDVQFSMKDSAGRTLSEGQQEYFKDSKVRDKNGNLLVVYHGSKTGGFSVFQYREDVQTGTDFGEAYYFTSDRQKASGYAYDVTKDERVARYNSEKDALRDKFLQTRSEEDKKAYLNYRLDGKDLYDLLDDENYLTEGGEVKEVYLNITNPLTVDAEGEYYYKVYPKSFEQARENGNDGIIFKNVIDNPRGKARPIDTYIVFSPEQIKNVDNMNPTEDPDIRFSMKDSAGSELTEEQAYYFEDSKVRDENGSLKVVYHGSPAKFTKFSYDFMGSTGSAEGRGFYFTDKKAMAEGYKRDGGQLMEGYLRITKPLSLTDKTMKRADLTKLLKALDPTGDDLVINYEMSGGVGYPSKAWYTRAVNDAVKTIWDGNDNDADILAEIANAGGSNENVLKSAKELFGYDGYIADGKYDGASVYVAFSSEQFKNKDNLAPTSDPDVRFSLKGQSDLLKENAKLKETVEGLKEQFKTTEFAKVDKKKLDAFTKTLLKDYESGADINETRDALDALYTYIANGEDGQPAAWNEVQRQAYDISVGILEGASVINDEMYQNYKEIRTRLRTRGVSIDKTFDRSIPGYESINEFRKANFGKLKITNDGTPVDIVYQDLADTYPELFDAYEYSNQADQIAHIADVLEDMKPYEVNPYAYNMREAATWLSNDIIERFYELPQAKPTFADKADAKLTKQVIKDAKKLEALRDKKNERIAKLIAESRERVNKTQAKERAKRAEAVERVREHYEAKEAKASDRRKASIWRKKINKHVETISRMLLKGNDNSHVPEEMREVVGEFLSVIDLTTPRQKEKTINRLNDLRALYKKIADNESDINIEVDPDLSANMDEVTAALKRGGDTVTVADLNTRELESLYRVILAVERSIYMSNRVMAEGKKGEITQLAINVMMENGTGKDYKEHNRFAQFAADTVNMDMLNPQDFFLQLGGTMNSMYQSIRDGFDTKIRHLAESQEYIEKLLGDTDVKALSDKKAVAKEFKTGNGDTIRLTPSQVMSLYLLQRQPGAIDHIYKGGIKPAPVVARDGKSRRPRVTRSYAVVKVTPDDVAKILESMTPQQKEIAEGISRFFTDYTAKWGNEVSLALYGYKKFTVENYFPIVSDQNYLKDVFGETNDATLKNMGSTKARIQGASNPIIIEDVFDVFARQADQMSSYNAFVIPLSDIQRVFNFKTVNGSVKQSIERRYGVRATQYFKKLMTDINGGGRWNGGSQLMSELISRYKQAKLGLNLRVVLQQPSAMLRAQAVLDSKYLAQAMTTRTKATTETIYKYAPIAQWKNWGFFSMDTGKQMKDVILDTKQLSDYTMWLAGKMDEITWKCLWVATELEIRDKHKDLEVDSDEYYTEVGKRFSEIIDRTQVVDSTLHRSQIMRNPDALVKMSVSFMNEPFKAYNMVRTAVTQFKHNPTEATKKALWAAGVAYLSTLVVNHLITAAVDTWRGDEDDEEWLEKIFNKITGGDDEEDEKEPKTVWQRYMWHFLDNVVNEPLSMFPYVKDVVSLAQGFDIKRMDMQGIGDFVNALTRGLSDKYTIAQKVIDIGSKFGDLFGVPVSSLKRELESLTKHVVGASGSPMLEYELDKALYTVTGNKGRFMDILYKAYKGGDMEAYEKIAQDMIDEGMTPRSIESGIKSRAKKDGITVGDLETNAFIAGIEAKYDVEKEEDGGFSADDLTSAQYTRYAEERGDILEDVIGDFQRRGLGSLDEETANALLSAAYTFAEETALESASGGEYVSDTKWVDSAQNADDLGMTVAEYIWTDKHHKASITAEGVYKAYEAGVDVDDYLTFRDEVNALVPDVDYIKRDSESRQAAIVAILDSMGLTEEEWDYLFGTEYKSKGGSGGSFGSGFSSGFGEDDDREFGR